MNKKYLKIFNIISNIIIFSLLIANIIWDIVDPSHAMLTFGSYTLLFPALFVTMINSSINKLDLSYLDFSILFYGFIDKIIFNKIF